MSGTESLNQTITLKGGRKLGFAEFGDFTGRPVFHFHGHANSRLEGKMFSEKAKELGIRLIVPDRPGYGLSDFYKWKLIEWPYDVLGLADHLNIEKFAILGISGGAPHAVACAYKISNQLTASAFISIVGPPGIGTKTLPKSLRFNLFMARRLPWLYKQFMKSQAKMVKNPEQLQNFYEKNAHRFPQADLKLLNDEEFFKFYVEIKVEGFRQGVKAAVHDAKVFASPWGFDLTDIPPHQNLIIWHGEDDPAFEMAQIMSTLIPDCKTNFFPNDGHVSVAINHTEALLTSLIK